MESTKTLRVLRVMREALGRRATVSGEDGTESGFTLIELMVVLLIMAILLAIAIPTFLGVKGGANDRAAQSNLTNGLISAKAVFANQGSYPAVATLIGTLTSQEPELTWTSGAVATTGATNQVSINVSSTGNQAIVVDYSASGNCYVASDNNGDGTAVALDKAPLGDEYAEWAATGTGGAACNAANFTAGGAGVTWKTSYPSSAGTVPA